MKKEFVFRVVLAVAIFFLVFQFGVKPVFNKSNKADRQDLSIQLKSNTSTDYDVIVYGCEPQGISAAISAARQGARTLLITEDGDVGGTVTDCLLSDLEIPLTPEKSMLNKGILEEFYKKLDSGFSDSKYISEVEKMLSAEKKLNVIYNTSIQGVNMNGGNIESLKLLSDGVAKVVSGQMFIDASDRGQLLDICKVPYFTGSGDLNLPGSFMPVRLNFEMSCPDSESIKVSEVRKLVNNREKFFKGIQKYEPLNLHTRLDELEIFFPGGNNVVIKGIQVSDVNVLEKGDLDQAYDIAIKESQNLALFLARQFEQFKDWKLSRNASKLQIGEIRHFRGKYVLTVNDILDNKYFDDTVAMGSYPVQTDKFAESGSYVAGKPVQYGIPLGCLIPEGISNLFMVGPEASFSSIAASSAGTIGTSIAAGEAAGAAAVFCLAKNESPSFIRNSREKMNELRLVLSAQNMYLPNRKIPDKNAGAWSYPAVRQLMTLGLVAGGMNNNLNFAMPARQEDFGYILLNGIYRLDKGSYSLELDARIRPMITESALTFDNAIKMLGALYNIEGETAVIYKKLCDQRHINDVMQLRMKSKKPLTMDDVYYLGAYTIRSYTGKDIPD